MPESPSDDELVRALVQLGTSPEEAEAAVQRGDPESAVFQPILLRERLGRTVTPADIAAKGGLSVEETGEVMLAFGFPAPAADEPTFTPDEAHVFIELGRLSKIWPRELRIQLSRLYGRTLARVADAELQAFRRFSMPLLTRQDHDRVAELGAVQSAFEELLPLADPLLTGVHRRWMEHELAQVAAHDAELRARGRLPGAVDVAFLFCDLKDFTRYVEAEGDAAAIGVIEEFFEVVSRERGDSGKIVKALGDGAMLAYDRPVDAVAAGARVIDALRSQDTPGVHASVHHGTAVAREGDYFGGAVNLTARLLALAERDELVATEAVIISADCDAFEWDPIGERAIRGVASPQPVFRLRNPTGPAALEVK
jgi:class 3 adenylate cyclase